MTGGGVGFGAGIQPKPLKAGVQLDQSSHKGLITWGPSGRSRWKTNIKAEKNTPSRAWGRNC